ncbi:hypothetical protein GQ43DRAFT_443347 [Delitschia confertaspora ATCC 74209]|uniref:RRM domain-containing protein n=1 Tax=Delitschia confertaspora ATCC 74209 TaxID=1513339 RepID=A0A9P4JKM4_9PLEO|nr:hypothetical protein GQ43DRAFT_443347 [Delitschia confertaspora ATCC 74209]
MFLLRRSAARALSAAPSKAAFSSPRSITTFTPAAFQSQRQQRITSLFQRRFLTDDATKTQTDADKLAEDKAVEAATSGAPQTLTEEFAQTAAEAPVDENIAPVEAEHAEGASADALGAAAGHAVPQTRNNRPFAVPAADPNRQLYIGNLFFEVTEDQLKAIFSRFGPIEELRLIRGPNGNSRGFGYITFENLADATAAVENLDMQVFEGRNMIVQYQRPRPQRLNQRAQQPYEAKNPPSRVLFIGNMSFQMSDKDLSDLFRDIRNVMDVRVAIDRRTGQPRGFAHADFIDVDSAVQAKKILQEKTIYGRKLRVDFGNGQTKQERDQERGPRQPREPAEPRGDDL